MNETNELNVAALYGGSEWQEPQTDPEDEEAARAAATEAMIAEAEQRGYLRGLNEAAERTMNRPGMWESIL